MADFKVTSICTNDPKEYSTQLARVYSLILSWTTQNNHGNKYETTDRGKFGDQTQSVAGDTPELRVREHHEKYIISQ